MEKRTPHCKLSVIKALIQEGKVRMTASAVASAELMGFNRLGMIRVILDLTPADFYKSMTTHADHTVWQDVYRPKTIYGPPRVARAILPLLRQGVGWSSANSSLTSSSWSKLVVGPVELWARGPPVWARWGQPA